MMMFSRSEWGNNPASAQAAYKSGAAWPLDRTNLSLPGYLGSLGLNRITEKKRVATISAAEQQLVGCPLPASVVERTLSIRSRAALCVRIAIRASCGIGPDMDKTPSPDG